MFLSGLFGIGVTLTICLFMNLPILLSLNDGGISAGMGVFQVGAGLILYTLGSRTLKAADLALSHWLKYCWALLGMDIPRRDNNSKYIYWRYDFASRHHGQYNLRKR